MKTNSVADLLKAKGVNIQTPNQSSSPISPSGSRKRLYQAPEEVEEAKLTTNLQQTYNKPPSKLTTNSQQTYNKPASVAVNENTASGETYNKPPSKLTTLSTTNLQQSYNELTTKRPTLALIGLQKSILIFLYNLCRQQGRRVTEPLSISHIGNACETTPRAAQETLRRLEQKKFVERVSFKNGRGGWTIYRLPETVYKELFESETYNKVTPNLQQTTNKLPSKLTTEPTTSLPIVVVPNSLSSKTTTIETEIETPCFLIPNELSGMVSRRQLTQFVLEGKISESELQMSLDAFAYDLRNKLVSTKHTANPVGLLIGAIKNNGGYNSQKFAEALKSEMKTALSSQQTLKDSISEAKSTEGWAKYQEMKTSSPEAFQALVSKYEKQGLKGDLLEEFGFLEFQEQNKVKVSEKNSPLRPADV
jgi:hypothetical protein